jgi:hypothetical protein
VDPTGDLASPCGEITVDGASTFSNLALMASKRISALDPFFSRGALGLIVDFRLKMDESGPPIKEENLDGVVGWSDSLGVPMNLSDLALYLLRDAH